MRTKRNIKNKFQALDGEMSFRDIAKKLGVSRATVWAAYHSGMKKLAILLDEKDIGV